MASSYQKSIYMVIFYVFLFLFLHQCELIVASRVVVMKFHQPMMPPSTNILSFNRYKKSEIVKDYSGPGHSPGMGHNDPPGAP